MTEVSKESEIIQQSTITATTVSLASEIPIESSLIIRTINHLHREMGVEDAAVKLNKFYNQMAGSLEKDASTIFIDHCYSRPWNWRPESNFLRPTKTLFVSKPTSTKRKSVNPLAPLQNNDDILDVEADPYEPPPIYDEVKAKCLMEECERHAAFSRVEQGNEDWEETIVRVNWTSAQNRLFNGMVNILNSDHMARLACSGVHNEPILRRTIIDKSVKRVRRLMATISWEPKLTQWLHQLLIDNLSTQYLAAYLDILQTLKSKLPTFVDKMMYGPNSTTKLGILSNESLFSLLKRSWDPIGPSLMQDKPKKLPGNPVIVIVPSAPSTQNSNQSKRMHKWTTLLSSLATVVTVHANIGTAGQRMTMMNCVDQMLAATRGKLQEIRSDYPGRNVILAGFNSGASLALQVAQVEPVLCVLCLGFSLLTAEGKRGDPDDNLLELQCPVLFVIGQCSNTSLQEDMEDLRERMRVETGLIVVGSADDYLRISKKKKKAEGITQNVVDRFIVDEVGEFVSGILLSPCPPQLRQSPAHISPDIGAVKRTKTERRRNNSNGSSVDSEPPSPTPRITRPVGRPPGSKSKAKLEAKWMAQMAQGTLRSPSPPSNSPPPPPLTPVTPDTSSTDSSSLTERSTLPPLIPTIDNNKAFKPFISSVNTDKSKKSTTNSSPSKTTIPTQGSSLSHLLQGNVKTVSGFQPKQGGSGIKVLQNVTLNTGTSAKLVSSSGRTIDLSKITVLNPVNPPKSSGPIGNVVLMPDGKLKTVGPSLKGTGIVNTIISSPSKASPSQTSVSTTSPRMTKYITSKKQLLGNKPPKLMKKSSYVPTPLPVTLPSPTNLTSQDIMDLPIIFADDNQVITDNSAIQPELVPTTQTLKLQNPNSGGKFVFVNKQVPFQNTGNIIISQSNAKRSAPNAPAKSPANTIKYTKIILSKRPTSDDMKSVSSSIMTKISNLSPEISVKKVGPVVATSEPIDLENELVATAVPKPNFGKTDVKTVTIIAKKPDGKCELPKPLQTILNEALAKRSAEMAELAVDDENDPDYVPPKSIKLDSLD